MNFNIKTKVKLFFSLSIVMISLSMAYVMYVGNDSKNNVVALEKSRDVESKISRLYDLSNGLKLDIVQVQQWLTDISATRGLDGLDDGYKEAGKYADSFNKRSKELLSLSRSMSKYKLSEVVESVINNFDPYYKAGKKMAKTYVDFGPAEGNKRMSAFDARAEKLNYSMSKVLKMSEGFLKDSERLANENTESLHTNILKSSTILNILGVVNIIILLLLARYIIFSVLNVLGSMTSNMVKLANGKDDVVIDGLKREDEMGEIARAIMFFKDNLIKTTKLLELNRKERNKKGGNSQFIVNCVKEFETSSSSILDGMKHADVSMKTISNDLVSIVKDSNRDVDSSVRASDEASMCVQGVSTAVEELAASVQEITRQVSTSSAIAGNAMNVAKSTTDEIGNLEEKVSKIGNVVQLITDIAEQTNLLALNATIEAARAGDAGKGFAVVASEVKSLANQTAKATDEISTQIKEIQNSTQDSAKSIHSVYEVIEKINEISMTISSSVEEQSAAAAEIARNSENASMKTREASTACLNAKECISKLEDSAVSVEKSSVELSNQNIAFTTNINSFLNKIQNEVDSSKDNTSSSSSFSTAENEISAEDEIDNKKAFIKWDNSILVGMDFIDAEHKKLINIINRFYVAVNSSDYNSDISELFDELVDYTIYHFGHEEDEMLKSNYPDKERHFAQHKQFVERLSDIYDRYKGGDKGAGKEILGFLASWLISHIKVLDKKLSLHLASL